MNLFRGVVQGSQVFPYPDVLNEDQKDTLNMLVDPTEKFFAVCKKEEKFYFPELDDRNF